MNKSLKIFWYNQEIDECLRENRENYNCDVREKISFTRIDLISLIIFLEIEIKCNLQSANKSETHVLNLFECVTTTNL